MAVSSEALAAHSIDFNRVMGREISNAGVVQISCPRHGEYMAKITRLSKRDIFGACPECSREHAAKEAAEKARESVRREAQSQAARLEMAAIPQRFIGRTFDAFNASTPAQQLVPLLLVVGKELGQEERRRAGGEVAGVAAVGAEPGKPAKVIDLPLHHSTSRLAHAAAARRASSGCR